MVKIQFSHTIKWDDAKVMFLTKCSEFHHQGQIYFRQPFFLEIAAFTLNSIAIRNGFCTVPIVVDMIYRWLPIQAKLLR